MRAFRFRSSGVCSAFLLCQILGYLARGPPTPATSEAKLNRNRSAPRSFKGQRKGRKT
jgi:hypothetical protein